MTRHYQDIIRVIFISLYKRLQYANKLGCINRLR